MKQQTFAFLLLLLLTRNVGVYAQDRHIIDSLQNEIKKFEAHKNPPLTDSTKANIFIELCKQYEAGSTDSAMYYANMALSLSQQAGYNKGVAKAYYQMGNIYYGNNNYPLVIEYRKKVIKIDEELGDKKGAGKCYLWIGLIYDIQGNYPDALKNMGTALELYKEARDSVDIADCYSTIGRNYEERNNYPEALTNFLLALKISESLSDKSEKMEFHNMQTISHSYGDIARIYEKQGNYAAALRSEFTGLKISGENNESDMNKVFFYNDIAHTYQLQGNYTEALNYALRSLDIQKRFTQSNYSIIRTYAAIGNIYLSQANYPEALKNFLTSLKIAEDAGDKGSAAYLYINVSTAYEKLGNMRQALIYGTKGLSLVLAEGETDHIKEAYKELAVINAKMNNYKAAYANEVLFKQYYDSVFNKENDRKLTSSQMQYDFDKKEDSIKAETVKKDALAQKEIRNQKNIRNSLIGGLLLVLGFAAFVFRSLRISRKQKIAIAAEKENADIQRVRAENSERVKQQFLANMSHEIRTPMNAVSGMTDLLIAKQPRPDQFNYLKVISKSSEMLLHIINDILDLSKIEVGKMELENIDFSLAETIAQVRDTLAFRAEEKGIQLITTIDDKIKDTLLGDPYRLNQILVNLGGNAIKFTHKGSVEIKVSRVHEEAGIEQLKFAVIDTGIGIPADKLQNLFESFKQVNRSDTRKYGGTGLGLSISRQLVELQGGSITVESKEGSGTTFSFALDYPSGSKEQLSKRVLNEQKADGSMLNGLRILLADDNEYNRLVVAETLHLKAEVTIDEAVNGLKAVQLLEKNDYDVVLMDVQMPEMNGFEATDYIRTKLPAPKNKVPVIALTASMLRLDIEMCYQHGMNTFVPKPFKAWQLITAIAEQTGRKQAGSIQTGKDEAQNSITIPGEITDLAYLTKFCEGDAERMKKYIAIYLAAVPGFEDKLKTAIAAKDMMEVAALMHTFKPKWMMMGMKQTNELGQKIETLCNEV